jgi:hypothetical protein
LYAESDTCIDGSHFQCVFNEELQHLVVQHAANSSTFYCEQASLS